MGISQINRTFIANGIQGENQPTKAGQVFGLGNCLSAFCVNPVFVFQV